MFNNKDIQIIGKVYCVIAFSVITIRVNADNTPITPQGSIISSNCMNNCVYSQTPLTGNNQRNIVDSIQSSQRFISGTQPNGLPCPSYQSILIDTKTHLMWVQSPSLNSYNWLNALKAPGIPNSYCGYSDWRLPSYAELFSLIKYGPYTPASWLNNHGFNNIQDNSYWASNVDPSNPANALYLDFSNGDDSGTTVQTTSLYVLPVRGMM